MHTRRCLVCGYSDSEVSKMHYFPTNNEKSKIWQESMGMKYMAGVSLRCYNICCRHFTSDCYLNIYTRKLRPDAVPTLYPAIMPRESVSKVVEPTKSNIQMPNAAAVPAIRERSSSSSSESIMELPEENMTATSLEPYLNVSTCENSIETPESIMQRKTSRCSGKECSSEPAEKRKCQEASHTSEIRTPYILPPKKTRVFNLMKRPRTKISTKTKFLQDKIQYVQKKVTNVEELVAYLEKKNLLCEEGAYTLMDFLSPDVKAIISRKIIENGKYSAAMRTFAHTLHLYSPKGYAYVRRHWHKLLPDLSTIREWYKVENGKPGFTKEAIQAMTLKAGETDKPVVVNLVIGEMSLREDIIYEYDKSRHQGGVEFGTSEDCNHDGDNPYLAHTALVFMCVSLNKDWKIPLGYFLIRSFMGSQRANLLKTALQLLDEAGVKVYSITCDHSISNIAMCNVLGADLIYGMKPYFRNPYTGRNCYIFLDLSHNIKLIRNTLGDLGTITTNNCEQILWKFIVDLHNYQTAAAADKKPTNKLTNKHIHYNEHYRMNTCLAMQTLSESVSKSLQFMSSIPEVKSKFNGCEATAKFCLFMNNIVDLLNCKSSLSKKGFCVPLRDENYSYLKKSADEFESYIKTLRLDNIPILQSPRKTGFFGVIVNMRNIFQLFNTLKEEGFTYLLTFKLSHDYLQTFFNDVRPWGQFSDEPKAFQFKNAYKYLLKRHELYKKYGGIKDTCS